jgi:hypothetical protein
MGELEQLMAYLYGNGVPKSLFTAFLTRRSSNKSAEIFNT